jgi:hypothetical protein
VRLLCGVVHGLGDKGGQLARQGAVARRPWGGGWQIGSIG